MQFVHFVS